MKSKMIRKSVSDLVGLCFTGLVVGTYTASLHEFLQYEYAVSFYIPIVRVAKTSNRRFFIDEQAHEKRTKTQACFQLSR